MSRNFLCWFLGATLMGWLPHSIGWGSGGGRCYGHNISLSSIGRSRMLVELIDISPFRFVSYFVASAERFQSVCLVGPALAVRLLSLSLINPIAISFGLLSCFVFLKSRLRKKTFAFTYWLFCVYVRKLFRLRTKCFVFTYENFCLYVRNVLSLRKKTFSFT